MSTTPESPVTDNEAVLPTRDDAADTAEQDRPTSDVPVDAEASAPTDGPEAGAPTDDEVTDDELDAAGQPGTDDRADADHGAAAPASRHDAHTEELIREGEIAADFLEALLDIADLSGDLEVDIEGRRAAVAIVDSEDGAAPRRLVGPGGNVLDALQELTRLAVQAETGERSRLMLDVAGYRADRRAALVKTAQEAIAQVRESGERQELEPVTAFERKVVHDEVLAAGLSSESDGVEPRRHVVVLPA